MRIGVGTTTPLLVVPAALAVAGCNEQQSVLKAVSPEADQLLLLWWILFWGSTAILLLVILFAGLAVFARPSHRHWLSRETTVVVGGVAFPIVTLTLLLIYGLTLTSADGRAGQSSDPLRITVVGEQWWWRVVYADDRAQSFESANELRIPVGRPVELSLAAADVIHSFWVPNLAGKLDMIPGRTNVLRLSASAPGISRGQCAEYCGGPHAMMAFYVVALPPDEFEQWRAQAASPASLPHDEQARHGQQLFLSSGCGGCHTIRGTAANGRIGPDLTHVGSRHSLAAGILPNDAATIARWIKNNQHIKPENRMPPYEIFSEGELLALSTYLAALK